MDKQIENRIVKTGKVNWRNFEFLQPKNFKDLSKESYQKLRKSIIDNNFVESFKVWQKNGSLYCLDGFHRCHILKELEKEGYQVPKLMPTDFIECKNKKEASKLVLIYSSIYARITDEGLYEFIHTQKLSFDELKLEIDLPDFKLERFEAGYMRDDLNDPALDEMPEPKEAKVKTGELYQLGRHRLLCGDATKKEDVERLMDGNIANAIVTAPPYGINREGIPNDDPEGLFDLFNHTLQNIPCKNGIIIAFQSPRLFIDWLKAIEHNQHKFGRALWWVEPFSPCAGTRAYPWHGWYMQGEIILVSMIGNPQWADYSEFVSDTYIHEFGDARGHEHGTTFTQKHPTLKPLWIIANLIGHTIGDIYDPFGGSGTTLIACEKLNRMCYMMEIEPYYCDVIIERYKNLTGKEAIKIDG